MHNGALHLAPLRRTFQMRPSFAYVDAADGADAEDEAAAAAPATKKLQAVSVKRATTTREAAAAKTSYAFKRQEQEAEPWTDLRIAQRDSAESTEKRAKLNLRVDEMDDEEDEEVDDAIACAPKSGADA